MAAPNRETVPRSPEEPTPEQVYESMVPGRCYVVADLVVKFEDQSAPSRWTVRDRLDDLAEAGKIVRTEHENTRVTYQRPAEL